MSCERAFLGHFHKSIVRALTPAADVSRWKMKAIIWRAAPRGNSDNHADGLLSQRQHKQQIISLIHVQDICHFHFQFLIKISYSTTVNVFKVEVVDEIIYIFVLDVDFKPCLSVPFFEVPHSFLYGRLCWEFLYSQHNYYFCCCHVVYLFWYKNRLI